MIRVNSKDGSRGLLHNHRVPWNVAELLGMALSGACLLLVFLIATENASGHAYHSQVPWTAAELLGMALVWDQFYQISFI